MSQLEIRAPAEQTEGTRSQILRWLKSIGDSVNQNEPLIEIETDKVTVEVASPGSGTLREILKQEQEEIAPGDLLGRIDIGSTAVEPATHPFAADGGNGATADVGAFKAIPNSAAPAEVGAFKVTPDRAALAEADASDRTATVAVSASSGAHHRAGAGPNTALGAPERIADGRQATTAASPILSPAVRRLLGERGLDASEISGTGQGGRVTVADVLAHPGRPGGGVATMGATAGRESGAGATVDTTTPGSTAGAAIGAPVVPGPAAGAVVGTTAAVVAAVADAATSAPSHRVPHTATRKRIAEHMVQSLLHTAPHVTTVFEADLTAVLDHRQQNKDEFARQSVPLTLTAYFLQAAVAALRAVPEANSRWTDTALEVFDSMHIGVATALETGLVVPVLRDVQSLDLFETARGLDDLVSRAREGRLSPSDMRGGTFTVSNHGVSGSLVATPIIINQPQSAILGVGKLEKRPVVVSEDGEDRLAIRPKCYVTLTIDHRVMDGHQANRFLQTFVERLASSHW